MHAGYVDWKHDKNEMGVFRLKRFSSSSKCLFSIVELKSPIEKILPYFVENTVIVLGRLLIKNSSFSFGGL